MSTKNSNKTEKAKRTHREKSVSNKKHSKASRPKLSKEAESIITFFEKRGYSSIAKFLKE